ncbi:hypothetical protein RRG08_012299 [Elysia crispata]|uniref:Uncharacterized protein n=1 Tax=Elysia crispata TaxID=231223 RepID=A0AAE1EDJ9_9GAST|nr:hypothetical protein RRG08_012299 [Elysia crispata]
MAHARSVTVLAFRNSAERSEIRSRAGNIPGAGVLGGRETVVVSCSVPCLSSKLLKTVGNQEKADVFCVLASHRLPVSGDVGPRQSFARLILLSDGLLGPENQADWVVETHQSWPQSRRTCVTFDGLSGLGKCECRVPKAYGLPEVSASCLTLDHMTECRIMGSPPGACKPIGQLFETSEADFAMFSHND